MRNWLAGTRVNDWRLSFIPLIMAHVYMMLTFWELRFSGSLFMLVILSLITSAGFAAFGYWMNEFFDQAFDLKAGKANKLAVFPKPIQILFGIIALLAAGLPWLMLPADAVSYILMSSEILFLGIYSAPPFRFKERALLAPLLDAGYGYVIPALLALHTYCLIAGAAWPIWGYFFTSWLMACGLRNIVFHQIDDYFADRRAGISTLPTVVKVQGVRRILILIYSIELISFMAVMGIIGFLHQYMWWVAGICLLIFAGFRWWRGVQTAFYFMHSKRHFLDHTYQREWPLIALLLLAAIDLRWLILALVHTALFISIKPLVFAWNIYAKPWASKTVNYTIYGVFRLFGVNLIHENTSAIGYIRKKLNR